MVRRSLSNLSYALGAVASIAYSAEVLIRTRRRIAKTDEVQSAREYVVVRLARGDYWKLDGISTMIYDYKFYGIITQPEAKK